MSFATESHARSIVKAISWRVLALVITVCVALFITGKVGFAAAIGLSDSCIKLVIYYLHERVWNRVRFGQVRPPEYQI